MKYTISKIINIFLNLLIPGLALIYTERGIIKMKETWAEAAIKENIFTIFSI